MSSPTVTNPSLPHHLTVLTLTPPSPPSDSLTSLLTETPAHLIALLIYLTIVLLSYLTIVLLSYLIYAESRARIAGCTLLTQATPILLTLCTGPLPTPGLTTPGYSPPEHLAHVGVMTNTNTLINAVVVAQGPAVSLTGHLARCLDHRFLALLLSILPLIAPTLLITLFQLKVHGVDVGILLIKTIPEHFLLLP